MLQDLQCVSQTPPPTRDEPDAYTLNVLAAFHSPKHLGFPPERGSLDSASTPEDADKRRRRRRTPPTIERSDGTRRTQPGPRQKPSPQTKKRCIGEETKTPATRTCLQLAGRHARVHVHGSLACYRSLHAASRLPPGSVEWRRRPSANVFLLS